MPSGRFALLVLRWPGESAQDNLGDSHRKATLFDSVRTFRRMTESPVILPSTADEGNLWICPSLDHMLVTYMHVPAHLSIPADLQLVSTSPRVILYSTPSFVWPVVCPA